VCRVVGRDDDIPFLLVVIVETGYSTSEYCRDVCGSCTAAAAAAEVVLPLPILSSPDNSGGSCCDIELWCRVFSFSLSLSLYELPRVEW
jgi:hypothetical protein